MLFHLVATHDADRCPIANGTGDAAWTRSVGKVAGTGWAATSGVTVREMLVCGPEHKLIFVLEAPELSNVTDFCRPIKHLGSVELTPVAALQGA